MFSSLRLQGTLFQIMHAGYPILRFVFFVLVRTFLRKGFVSMHTWYCICAHYWHIENSLKTVSAEAKKQIDRYTDSQTDRQTDRRTDGRTY